jgi:hypothetical protein
VNAFKRDTGESFQMKTKTYRSGKLICRSYIKAVGNGWETGFIFNNKPIFVGNFIHSKEDNQWFVLMNKEILSFVRKYTVGSTFPETWFSHFIRNNLYKSYYLYLDRLFAKYTKNFNKLVLKDVRRYQQLKKHWYTGERRPLLKVA